MRSVLPGIDLISKIQFPCLCLTIQRILIRVLHVREAYLGILPVSSCIESILCENRDDRESLQKTFQRTVADFNRSPLSYQALTHLAGWDWLASTWWCWEPPCRGRSHEATEPKLSGEDSASVLTKMGTAHADCCRIELGSCFPSTCGNAGRHARRAQNVRIIAEWFVTGSLEQ